MICTIYTHLLFSYRRHLVKMSKGALDRIIQNATEAENAIAELKNEIKLLTSEYNKIRISKLTQENDKLEAEVEEAKKRLIQIELSNGVPQIVVPNVKVSKIVTEPPSQIVRESASKTKGAANVIETAPAQERIKNENANAVQEKIKKEKKPKETKEKLSEPPVDFGRLDLRVAKVVDVQRHPDADSLYLLKIDCGEPKPRTVCSGLVKHVPIENLKDISVVLLCNLKPVKMRGVTSEAMVMCASSPDAVEVLIPPPGCSPGDPVECEGYNRQPDPIMNPKKKIFETVALDLCTNDELQACYKGTPWSVPGKGNVVAKTLKNVNIK